MGEIIIAALVIAAIYFFVVYIVAPIAGILLIITLVLSFGYAFLTSARSFITSLIKHKNPYTSYVDKSTTAPPGTKRSYFFGPGYNQVRVTVSEAFSLQKSHLAVLKVWKNKHTGHPWYRDMWIWIFYCATVFCTFVLGFAWMAFFSILLSTVIITGMCAFYIFFMSLWGVDRLILMIKAIESRCPNCKRISVIPTFICPDCGMEHKKLTPGPYGIWGRKCSCGKYLSTTYFNGRSRYMAVCPFCSSELATSDARQFGIQLVGGVSTGKTTFLASFWHEYLERVKQMRNISTIATPTAAFSELEYWFQHGDSSATTETNANIYSLIHKDGEKTPIQMTIYDIAGEAFSSLENDVQQQQFQYCEGIIIVIDPTVAPIYASETVSSFIHRFDALKGTRSSAISDVPVAVMITKADLCKRRIGLPRIKTTFNTNASKYADTEGNTSMELVRNGICRDFLNDEGFSNVINLVDAQFNRVQYYSVSAMGHPSLPGRKYEPWGVLEPIIWIMQQQGSLFRDIVSQL